MEIEPLSFDQRQCLLHGEQRAARVEPEGAVELFIGDIAEDGRFAHPGAGPQHVDRALLPLDGVVKRSRSSSSAASPCTAVTLRPISLTASSKASCRRAWRKTCAPSSTNSLAPASAMPVDPPVITATLPSSFPTITPLGLDAMYTGLFS